MDDARKNGHGAATQPFTIRVISLIDSPRRAEFTQTAKTTLEWEFFDAHTSNTTGLTYTPRKAELHFGRAMTPGEIGCYSSHYALWAFCASSGKPIIIFEDDVEPDWSFMEALAQNYEQYAGIDFLRFYSLFAARRVTVDSILDRKVVELLGDPRGMQGYLMTPAHGQRLVDGIHHMARPVDDEVDRVWHYGAPNLVVDPPPLSLHEWPSEIGDRDSQFKRKEPPRLVLKTVERLRKEFYMAVRRIKLRAF
jgi:glycosyl transferase family 25